MKNKIKTNIILVLAGWLVLIFITACHTSNPCYNNKKKEVRINQKEYNKYSGRHY